MEQQKLLWTILSVGILVLILLGAGMFFFLPSDSTGLAQNGKTTEWSKAASPAPEQKAPDTKATPAPAKPEVKKTPVQTAQTPAPAPKPEVKKTPVQPATPAPAPKATPAPATKPAQTTAPKATPAPQTKPSTTTTTTQAAKPAQTTTAKPAQTQQTKPAATTSTAAKGSYWVQVGSYATTDAAEKIKKELSAKGYTSSIQSITANGKTYHRVKIGPYTSRADVDTLLPKIKALPGMGDSFITTK
ncbi:MAG: SPOR domain-containing protein [Spirochaetia bacterium]|nr:SPOR domain-containing protein [Spirochaetia bacterium]